MVRVDTCQEFSTEPKNLLLLVLQRKKRSSRNAHLEGLMRATEEAKLLFGVASQQLSTCCQRHGAEMRAEEANTSFESKLADDGRSCILRRKRHVRRRAACGVLVTSMQRADATIQPHAINKKECFCDASHPPLQTRFDRLVQCTIRTCHQRKAV